MGLGFFILGVKGFDFFFLKKKTKNKMAFLSLFKKVTISFSARGWLEEKQQLTYEWIASFI